MNDEQYLSYCTALLDEFSRDLMTRTRDLPEDHPLKVLAGQFSDLDTGATLYEEGPALVGRLFSTFPDFAPTFPRVLLWFLGGDCLHFMPDDEIARFQSLEDMRLEAAARGETFNLAASVAGLENLH